MRERKSEQVAGDANRTLESLKFRYLVIFGDVVQLRAIAYLKVAWSIFDAHLVKMLYLVRYGTLEVEDDRIGECAFDLSAYHL